MTIGSPEAISRRQRFTEDLAVEAAARAMAYFQALENLAVESKNPLDFVSEADRAVERFIRERIEETFPGENVVGEEGGGVETERFWSLDPIDGTANFLGGIPLWGVSIGFCEGGVPSVGAICIPRLDILLSADRDQPGIRYNGVAKSGFRQSAVPTIVLMGAPNAALREVEDLMRGAGMSLMNTRCSVVSSAFAILGMTHGYYQEQLNMWDVAAAYVLATNVGLHTSIRRNASDPRLNFSILTQSAHDKIGAQLARRPLG